MSLSNSRTSVKSVKIPNTSKLPTPPSLEKSQNEELQRMNQDLNLLSQKLIELQSNNGGQMIPSSFVNGIRESTNATPIDINNFAEIKIQILEKLIFKMTEIDRFILRNTESVDENDNGDPANKPIARRASRGMDLATFPTHLHIIDRLVDVHKKAQRVAVVVKNGSRQDTPALNAEPSPEILTHIKKLENQVKQLTLDLAESRECDKKNEMQSSKYINEITKLTKVLSTCEEDNKRLQSELKNQKAPAAISFTDSEDYQHLQEQIRHLNETVAVMTKNAHETALQIQSMESSNALTVNHHASNVVNLEERLECEINNQEKLLNVLISVANKVEIHCTSAFFSETDEQSVSSEAFSVLTILVSAIIKRMEELCDEINILSATNEELESQIVTFNLERDICQKDIEQLQFLNKSLRTDKIALENDYSKKFINSDQTLSKEVEQLRELNRKLTSELTQATVQITMMGDVKDRIHDLEATIMTNQCIAESDKMKHDNRLTELMEENNNYKRLTDELKRKLRELSGKSGVDAKEFLETFEEVMKEEMMTMKSAFEKKLQIARTESEELTRRHANEIRNLSTNSGGTPIKSTFPSNSSLTSSSSSAGSKFVSR